MKRVSLLDSFARITPLCLLVVERTLSIVSIKSFDMHSVFLACSQLSGGEEAPERYKEDDVRDREGGQRYGPEPT